MDFNKWEAFLSDSELKRNQKYQGRHNGEYLFGKISHDALACLNNYLAVLSLMREQDVTVGREILAWFEAQEKAVKTAVTKIYSFLDQTKGLPETIRDWPADIKVLGSKLSEVQNFADEFQDIDELTTSMEAGLVKMAVANLYGVQTIFNDILAENYGQLLTTKYHT